MACVQGRKSSKKFGAWRSGNASNSNVKSCGARVVRAAAKMRRRTMHGFSTVLAASLPQKKKKSSALRDINIAWGSLERKVKLPVFYFFAAQCGDDEHESSLRPAHGLANRGKLAAKSVLKRCSAELEGQEEQSKSLNMHSADSAQCSSWFPQHLGDSRCKGLQRHTAMWPY